MYKDIFIEPTANNSSENLFHDFVRTIIIADKSEFTCRLTNYLQNSLRFISAYIITGFMVIKYIYIQKIFLSILNFKYSFIYVIGTAFIYC